MGDENMNWNHKVAARDCNPFYCLVSSRRALPWCLSWYRSGHSARLSNGASQIVLSAYSRHHLRSLEDSGQGEQLVLFGKGFYPGWIRKYSTTILANYGFSCQALRLGFGMGVFRGPQGGLLLLWSLYSYPINYQLAHLVVCSLS